MGKTEDKSKRQRMIIVWAPNIIYVIALILSILLVPMLGLPWILFPGQDVLWPWRFIELLTGLITIVLAVALITWGTASLGISRAQGSDVGIASPGSKLMTKAAYSYCRHPITLGFVLATPGFALALDLMPLILNTIIYTPFLIALLFYEEMELLQRFGESYTKYRDSTPFMIPRGLFRGFRKPKGGSP